MADHHSLEADHHSPEVVLHNPEGVLHSRVAVLQSPEGVLHSPVADRHSRVAGRHSLEVVHSHVARHKAAAAGPLASPHVAWPREELPTRTSVAPRGTSVGATERMLTCMRREIGVWQKDENEGSSPVQKLAHAAAGCDAREDGWPISAIKASYLAPCPVMPRPPYSMDPQRTPNSDLSLHLLLHLQEMPGTRQTAVTKTPMQ